MVEVAVVAVIKWHTASLSDKKVAVTHMRK
jgi:hypothetical protein